MKKKCQETSLTSVFMKIVSLSCDDIIDFNGFMYCWNEIAYSTFWSNFEENRISKVKVKVSFFKIQYV